jgi:hypothetical protein
MSAAVWPWRKPPGDRTSRAGKSMKPIADFIYLSLNGNKTRSDPGNIPNVKNRKTKNGQKKRPEIKMSIILLRERERERERESKNRTNRPENRGQNRRIFRNMPHITDHV